MRAGVQGGVGVQLRHYYKMCGSSDTEQGHVDQLAVNRMSTELRTTNTHTPYDTRTPLLFMGF